MKSSHIALIVASCSILGLVGLYVVESNRSATNSDEFIDDVRERAATIIGEEARGEGIIPGTSGDADLVPRIRVPEELVLEDIPPGENFVTYIDIYNDGTAPLNIEGVETDCGCTVGEMVESTISGGESGRMRVTILPEYIHNLEVRRTLSIISNDPVNRMVKLPVHSKLDAEVALDPRYVSFGEVSHGESRSATIRLWQTKDTELLVNGLTLEGDNAGGIKTALVEIPESEWRAPGKREYDVTIALAADAPLGRIALDVVCDLSLESQPKLKIPVRALVRYFALVDNDIQSRVTVVKPGGSAVVATVTASRPFALDFTGIKFPAGITLAVDGEESDLERSVVLHVDESVAVGNYIVQGPYAVIDPSGLSEDGSAYTRLKFRVE